MAEASRAALPALPALTELLRLSDVAGEDADWRSGLLHDLGAGSFAAPPAVIAAAALPVPAGRGVCLAAPVHAVAGLHRVHLHAAGILPLAPGEKAILTAGFAAQFADDLRLHDAGDHWLVEADFAAAADESDPLEWAGAPLERRLAGSPLQRVLRRIGAEIEMWLADHPVNAARRSRGQVPVNLLWLWGGGTVVPRETAAALASTRLSGATHDAWLAGCATLCGGTLAPLPDRWPPGDAARGAMVLPAAVDAGQLLAWESDWFAPALAELRAGRLESLRLRVGRRLHHVRPGRLRRFLRRARPWWQVAAP